MKYCYLESHAPQKKTITKDDDKADNYCDIPSIALNNEYELDGCIL